MQIKRFYILTFIVSIPTGVFYLSFKEVHFYYSTAWSDMCLPSSHHLPIDSSPKMVS